MTKNVSGVVKVGEWGEEHTSEGHCGTEGEMEDDFMTQRA